MAGTVPGAVGRIFISYRREETAYSAGWLFDRLTDHFGPGQVFKDVDSIAPGDDFIDAITTAVGRCDVLLALIGEQWLSITDDGGARRLDNPTDFVRLEIEAALDRSVRVVPVLIDGTSMPRSNELPPSLARLARRNALELSPSRFDADLGRLLKVLETTLVQDPAPVHPGTDAPRHDRAAAADGKTRASRPSLPSDGAPDLPAAASGGRPSVYSIVAVVSAVLCLAPGLVLLCGPVGLLLVRTAKRRGEPMVRMARASVWVGIVAGGVLALGLTG